MYAFRPTNEYKNYLANAALEGAAGAKPEATPTRARAARVFRGAMVEGLLRDMILGQRDVVDVKSNGTPKKT